MTLLKKLFTITALVLTSLSVQAQVSGTFTVGSGADYETIEDAITGIHSAGGLGGDVILELQSDFTSSSLITIVTSTGYQNYSVTIRPASDATDIQINNDILFNHTKNVIFSGANPSNGNKVIQVNGKIQLSGNGDGVHLDNLKINLQETYGVQWVGINGYFHDNVVISQCEFFTETPLDIAGNIYPIYSYPTTNPQSRWPDNILIEGNKFYGIEKVNQLGAVTFIWVRTGLYAHNNAISHTFSEYLTFARGISHTYQYGEALHNTLHFDGGDGTFPARVLALDFAAGTGGDGVVANNIVSIKSISDGSVDVRAIGVNTQYEYRHNNVYIYDDGVSTVGYIGSLDLEASLANDGTLTTAEPFFVDPSVANLELTGSALLEQDLRTFNTTSVTTDHNGDSRHASLPSKGAFEAPNMVADITAFTHASKHVDAVIDSDNSTALLEVVNGTDLTSINPTIGTYFGSTVSPTSGTTRDFSTPQIYTVTAEHGNTRDWTTSIVLQNDAPTDISLTSMSIDENSSIGTLVGILSSADVDVSDSHSYELVAGDGDDDNSSFFLDNADLEANALFDYETKNSYSIRIRTDDNVAHGGTFEKMFTISINDLPDETPTAINLDNSTIVEGAPIGTVVGNLSTDDIDVVDDHTYTLVGGSGDSGNGSFNIDGDQLVAAESFDFDDATSYSVRLRTTDNGGAFFEQEFTITIKAVAEGPQGAAAGDEQKITPGTRYSYDNFGDGVAISGGYAIIGAKYNNYDENEENYVRDAGAAYIYEKDAMGAWSEVQKIVEPTRGSYHSFGQILAIDGDYAAIGVVSAADPNTGNNDGLVYIYERNSGGVWNYVQSLVPSGSNDDGIDFGYAVDISGDYLVASAIYDSYDENGANYFSEAGAAYIFERNAIGVWEEVQKIVASDRQDASYYYGEQVAISGDYIAISAPEAPSLAVDGMTVLEQTGAVYVYERNAMGEWSEAAKLVASDREEYDYMGYTIAIDGGTLAVGNADKGIAGGEDEEGAVYVFERSSGGVWEENLILTPEVRFTEQGFGRSVRLSDGNMAVGSYFDDVNQLNGIFIFTQDGDNWIESDIVAPALYENSTEFGETIDLDGTELIVGERYANYDFEGANSLTNAGAAYVFELCANPDLPTIEASSELVCANSSVTLSVGDASLNDAVSWEWFSESCGGTPVGSGASITVNPTATTTYYVRGEGACTNSTTCSFITIEIYDECPFNDILTFSIPDQVQPAEIDSEDHTVAVLMPAGTNASSLIPTFTISEEATVSPESGVAQDFTSNIIYTVTAIDGTEQEWEVEVEEEAAAPTDIILSSNTVDELSVAGTVVAELSVEDANFSDFHTYYVVAVLEDDDWQSFDIDGTNLIATDFITLDFETKNTFTFELEVRDDYGEIFSKDVTITLNDVNEEPTEIDLSNRNIDESTPIGTLVGVFSTTDVDAGDSHTYTYSLGCDVCDLLNEEDDPFVIVGNELRSNIVFDYETLDGYAIEVTSTDEGGLSTAESFVITINDLPAQVTSIDLSSQSVDENESSGTAIGSFTTTGEDLSGSYTYTLVSGDGDDDNGSFSITDDQLFASSSFNYETKSNYSIRVLTNDGTLTREEAFTISVNNVAEAPTDLSLSEATLAENNAENAVIGSLTTTDEDEGESHTYSLVSGDGDTDNASFNIDGDELRATDVFDFEVKSSYSVRIETNDGNGGTYQEAFTITITNENESISVVNPIADESREEGFGSFDIDLTNVFSDEDGDALTYSVSSSDASVVTVANSGATLTVTEVGIGTATITVMADDGSGVTTSDEFMVEVTATPLGLDNEVSLQVYPNPTSDFVNIQSDKQVKIQLINLRGQVIRSANGQSLRLDLQNLSSGTYLLKISDVESSTTRRIIKAN